jgi:hypothetical protein
MLMLARTRVLVAAFLCAVVFSGCELRRSPSLITVYNGALKVSFPLPQGWSADEAVMQSGFHMQTFTGRSVDVPERPGIRAQILAGPMPSGEIDEVAERFKGQLDVDGEQPFELEGRTGKFWRFISDDGEEASQLMLTDVEDTLYGLYVHGEARTLEAYDDAVARMFADFSIERSEYFEVYEGPGGEVVIKHPTSWGRTHTAADSGQSLFVSFRSTPLAVEAEGATVHATLEVTINKAEPGTTVESFYAARTELLGDTYRLVRHEVLEDVGAVSTLYYVTTQLADYLERTVYFVQDDKTYIYKFNARNQVYYAIEPWINDIVTSFFGVETEADSGDAS